MRNKVLDFYEDSDVSSAGIRCQITNIRKEKDLRLDMVSAYIADNASVNYGKHNSVFHRL